jgi:archaellum component FlaC
MIGVFYFKIGEKMNEKIAAIKTNLRMLLMRFEELVIRNSAGENSKNIHEIFEKLNEIEKNLKEIEGIFKNKKRKAV